MAIRNLITTALLLLLAGVGPGYGQKVYKQGNAIILDCGSDSGFPQGAVETRKGQKIAAGTPSDTTGPLTDNTYTGSIDATVYQKLEIAPKDLPDGMTWTTAYLTCQKLGEGWRLPTQRELMLIYIFKDAVVGLGGTAFANALYWTSIEYDTTQSRGVRFDTGNARYGNKSLPNVSTRCVREL